MALSNLDADKNSYVDVHEFSSFVLNSKCNEIDAFKIIDSNDDGFITRSDLQKAFPKQLKVTEEEIDLVVQMCVGSDGRI